MKVHVGATAASIASVCPKAPTTCWASNTSWQTPQCLPSVKPVKVHVGATAWSITSVWPNAEIVVCCSNTTSHTLQ